jgi:hypothetical protein
VDIRTKKRIVRTGQVRGPARVVNGWLFVQGCKVARVSGRTLAFKDKCRVRCNRRGTDQVRITLTELEQVLDQAEQEGVDKKPERDILEVIE